MSWASVAKFSLEAEQEHAIEVEAFRSEDSVPGQKHMFKDAQVLHSCIFDLQEVSFVAGPRVRTTSRWAMRSRATSSRKPKSTKCTTGSASGATRGFG